MANDNDRLPGNASEVGPGYDDVMVYARFPNGVINDEKLKELQGRYFHNSGDKCDVEEGHCACGACHVEKGIRVPGWWSRENDLLNK